MTRKSKEPNQHIKPMLLEKLLRRDAELKNAHLTKRVADLEWREKMIAHANRMERFDEHIKVAQDEFQQVVREVEKAHKINMRDYAYDTETGRLTKVEQ